MDNTKVGELIRALRREKGMTQLQLAEALNVSDKAVSKWERGMGCPEVGLIGELSRIFEVDMQDLVSGELRRNKVAAGNIKSMKLYICPECGNFTASMAETVVTCCGRRLRAGVPVKASPEEKLNVERIENDYYITTGHEMTKEHYITFVALMTSDTVIMKKLYPEWDVQARIPAIGRGRLIWHCSRHGIFYQNI